MANKNHDVALSQAQKDRLDKLGWKDYVGADEGLWVCIADQQLRVVRDGRILRAYRCSTAEAGAGSLKDSFCTPLGWHEIGEKAGDELPLGAVLEARQWTGEVWKPGDPTDKDLVLSRVLRLTGLEEGQNRGGDVDTWERLIYIHGTHAEEDLGRPVSHGCVRLSNADVIELYDRVDLGCRVLITLE